MNMDKLWANDLGVPREKIFRGDIDQRIEALRNVDDIDPRIFSLYTAWKAEYGELVGSIWSLGFSTVSGLSILEQDFFADKHGQSISLQDLDAWSEASKFKAFYKVLESMGMVMIEEGVIRFTQRCEEFMKFRALCQLIKILHAQVFDGGDVAPLSQDQVALLESELV